MLNILPGHKFLSLQFLLGYLFVLCKLRFWSETVCPFQSGSVQCGRSESSCVCVCVHPPWALLVPCCILGALFPWMCSMTRESTSTPLSSALRSAFLSMCSKNSLFWAPTLCPAPLFGRGTPYQLHHCEDRMAHIASVKGHPLDAWWLLEHAYVDGLGSFTSVLKVNMKIWTSWFAWLDSVFWVKWITNHFQSSPLAAAINTFITSEVMYYSN